VVISPNAPDAMIKYAQECQALNVRYVFDPSQQIVRLDEQGLLRASLAPMRCL
jgi:adenosine kinase